MYPGSFLKTGFKFVSGSTKVRLTDKLLYLNEIIRVLNPVFNLPSRCHPELVSASKNVGLIKS